MNMYTLIRSCAACVLVAVCVSAPAHAQNVTGAFTTGQLDGDGFPGINSAPAVNMTAVSGSTSGSTGAGIGDAAASISTAGSGVVISVTGSATHSDNQNGYTSVYTSVFPIIRINRAANFSVLNTSTIGSTSIVPVIFEPVSGTGASISGNVNTSGSLTAGDYRLRFAVIAGNTSAFPFFNTSYAAYSSLAAGYYSSATMNWRMTLTVPDSAVACCRGSTCSVIASAQCTGRSIAGATTCNTAANAVTPCCKADYNQSQSVTVQDIFDFVNAWFASNPLADFNGAGGVTVQDIFDFVGAWFNGC